MLKRNAQLFVNLKAEFCVYLLDIKSPKLNFTELAAPGSDLEATMVYLIARDQVKPHTGHPFLVIF